MVFSMVVLLDRMLLLFHSSGLTTASRVEYTFIGLGTDATLDMATDADKYIYRDTDPDTDMNVSFDRVLFA